MNIRPNYLKALSFISVSNKVLMQDTVVMKALAIAVQMWPSGTISTVPDLRLF